MEWHWQTIHPTERRRKNGCVENEERNLSLYLENSTASLLQLVRNKEILPEFNETAKTANKIRQEERRNQWRVEQLQGKFLRDRRYKKCWVMAMDKERISEEGNWGFDICNARPGPQNWLDKEEHWWSRDMWKVKSLRRGWWIDNSPDSWTQKTCSNGVQRTSRYCTKNCTARIVSEGGVD